MAIQHASRCPRTVSDIISKVRVAGLEMSTYVGVRPQSWDSGKGLFLGIFEGLFVGRKKELDCKAL
jgi:hypothetical protein